MDGHYMKGANEIITVAFLTADQAQLYGGYVVAAKVLKVNIIRPPLFLEEHFHDMSSDAYPEVGHA